MRCIAITSAAVVLIAAATACRSSRSAADSAAVVRHDTVSIVRRDSAESLRTRVVERPVITIERIDSPRRLVTITAARMTETAASVAVTDVAVDSAGRESLRSESRSDATTSGGTSPLPWLAAGIAAGLILRSFAGTRSRR